MRTSYSKARRQGLEQGKFTSNGFVESHKPVVKRSYAGLGCVLVIASLLLGLGLNYLVPELGITFSLVVGLVVGLVSTR